MNKSTLATSRLTVKPTAGSSSGKLGIPLGASSKSATNMIVGASGVTGTGTGTTRKDATAPPANRSQPTLPDNKTSNGNGNNNNNTNVNGNFYFIIIIT